MIREIKSLEEYEFHLPDPSHQTVTSTPPVIAPFTDVSSTKPSSLVTPPPINTEATTITTSLPEITPIHRPLAKVARLEQGMLKSRRLIILADVLASIKSQAPTVMINNKEYNLMMLLLKILERHTADLSRNALRWPGQGSQQEKKTPNLPLQGHSASFERLNHQSSKKPRESDASASKQHQALTSTGWQITDTRDEVGFLDESTVNSRPQEKELDPSQGSSEGKANSLVEADVISEHFDRDDNAGDDNEETKA
ncbi:hypothetical protein Tco_1220270 [Tanacetum coccineum]